MDRRSGLRPVPGADPPPSGAASGGHSGGHHSGSTSGSSRRRGGGLPRPGDRIGPYQLDAFLGMGGMGAVYRARRLETGLVSAVKIIRSDLVAADAQLALDRFRREIEVMKRVERHPAIVSVHDCGLEGRLPWCSMDFVEGAPLSDRIARQGALRCEEAAEIVAEVARATQFANEHGIVHRDLKPQNIIIDPAGRPHVLDFGLAYDAFSARLTRSGDMVGTPAFMAPEQVNPVVGGIGPRTDVYGLGGILFASLTGRAMFGESDTQSVLIDVASTEAPRPSRFNPGVPSELEAICLQALEKAPSARYPSALVLAEELERWLRGDDVETKSRGEVAHLVRRVGPRTRGGRAAALALVGAGLVGIAAAVFVSVGLGDRRDPVAELAALEERFDAVGELDATERALLDELAESSMITGVPHLARRARVLELLGDRDEGTVAELAVIARHGGLVDRAIAARVAAGLARDGRMAALERFAFGGEPMVALAPEVAIRLAEAMVEDTRLAPPEDDDAFAALIATPGLAAATAGHLRLRRADALLIGEPGPELVDEALLTICAAAIEHGVHPPRLAEPVRRRAIEVFLDHIQGDLRVAWAINELLIDVDGLDETIHPEFHQAIEEEKISQFIAWQRAMGRDRIDADALSGLRFRACLLGFGRAHVDGGMGAMRDNPQVIKMLRALANEELGKPPEKREGAVLVVLAQILAPSQTQDERDNLALAWLRTAADRPRSRLRAEMVIDATIARSLFRLGHYEAALPLAERAAEDNARTPPDRLPWPIAPALVSAILVHLHGGGGDPEALLRAAAVQLDALEQQRLVDAHHEPKGKRSWDRPSGHRRGGDIVTWTVLLLARLRDAGPPFCCGGDGGQRSASTEELVEAALKMTIRGDDPEWVIAHIVEADALHHERHGRHDEAERRLGEAIEGVARADDEDAGQRRFRQRLHVARARLRRELGREADAAADDAEAARLGR